MMMFILWAGILIPPIAFLLHLQINYSLVSWVCVTGKIYTIHLATIAMILLAASGGFAAWIARERMADPRSRFMSTIGLMMSALFFSVIIAQAIPTFMFGPCQR